MHVFTLASLKGGVGKSTLATNIAAALHRDGHRTLVVDADPQATATAWGATAAERGHDGPPVVAIAPSALRRDIPRLGAAYDVVIVDSPARLAGETRVAMAASDLVVVPFCPGAPDLWSAAETCRVLADAQDIRPELRAVSVLNRSSRTQVSRVAERAMRDLGIPPLDVAIGARTAFGEAMMTGRGVIDTHPSSDAAREIRRLVRALVSALTDKEVAA